MQVEEPEPPVMPSIERKRSLVSRIRSTRVPGNQLAILAAASVAAGASLYTALLIGYPTFAARAGLTPSAGQNARASGSDIAAMTSVLRSPETLSRVVSEFELGNRPEFTGRAGDVLGVVAKRLSVESGDSNFAIGVSFTSLDPSLASAIAQKIAEIGRDHDDHLAAAERASARARRDAREATLRQEIANAEAAAEKERQPAKPDERNHEPQIVPKSLAIELAKAADARRAAETRLRNAKGSNAKSAASPKPAAAVANLKAQRSRTAKQLAALRPTLPRGHPRLKRLSQELASLDVEIADAPRRSIVDLDHEAKVAAAREQGVQIRIDSLKPAAPEPLRNAADTQEADAKLASLRAELTRLTAMPELEPVNVQRTIWTVTQPRSATMVLADAGKLGLSAAVTAGLFLAGLALLWARARHSSTDAHARRTKKPAIGSDASSLASFELPHAANSKFRAELAQAEAALSGRVVPVRSMRDAAAFLMRERPQAGRGLRILLTGDTESLAPMAEAVALGRSLVKRGHQALVIDWSVTDTTTERDSLETQGLGLTDLLRGSAVFEEAIAREPDSDLQVIASGSPLAYGLAEIPVDDINLILDALDEAYACIIIVARTSAARELFECIEGRFDAGIVVTDDRLEPAVASALPNSFLGFAVEDIELLRFARRGSSGDRGVGRSEPLATSKTAASPSSV